MAADTLLDTELRYIAEDDTEAVTTVRAARMDRLGRARPVRVIRSFGGQRHYSGLFWSSTTRGHVPYESRLELDRLWLADFDPEVSWIAAQPMWLTGSDDGTPPRHAPDLLLTGRDGDFTVVDVKPLAFVGKPDVAAVFAWTARVCAARGWSYEVWSGADPVLLANIRALGYGRRLPLLAPGCESAPGVARRYKGWSAGDVIDLSGPLSESSLATVSGGDV